MGVFRYSWLDFVLSGAALPFLLLDVVLDGLAVWSFYQAGAYGSLGVLLLLLGGSSVLVQAYSWLWYSYDRFLMGTRVEKSVGPCGLKLLHLLQLGLYFRYLGVLETSVKSFCRKGGDSENRAVYLSHDLSMLRLVETFSESAPQVVLMLTAVLREDRLHAVPVMKAVASASAVALCVTTYHRSLRSFLPTKHKPTLASSLVFYFWNFLLIVSRLAALALFASVLPCAIFPHFLCCWTIFFLLAWAAQTDFMESAGGEWLYRATVGLIWYFDWFSVAEGQTRFRTLLYHGFMLVDISALTGVWCWKTSSAPLLNAAIAAACVVLLYILGLLLKLLYYWCFHPNVGKEELKGDSGGDSGAHSEVDSAGTPMAAEGDSVGIPMAAGEDSTGISMATEEDCMFRSIGPPRRQTPPSEHCNRRMKKLAENFYA